MINNKVITISGPTASGKTKFSIALAREINNKFNTEAVIVNFDSLLFYKEISIGTAKPTKEEKCEIDHRMIDICSIFEPMNASEYVEMARKEINSIHMEGKIPILVGGSGFYLRSLIKGMYQATTPPVEIKNKIDSMYASEGIGPFIEILKDIDPESLTILHENDHYRIQRAVEYYWITGQPISSAKREMEDKFPYDFSQNLANNWDTLHIYLDLDKETHYRIICDRAESMIKNGLENEVRELLKNGATGRELPLQSIGYKEIIAYINGEFSSLDECIERICISTRQLAKSQRTWYKKVKPKICYNSLTDLEKFISDCTNFLF